MWNIRKTIKKGDYLYALVPEHPKATKNGYVLYHRVAAENMIGRLLKDNKVVHHINHNKFDNREENLMVLTKEEHAKLHKLEDGRKWAKLRCPICGKIFNMPYNQTTMQKHPHDLTKVQCCSRHCGCTLGRFKQLNKITPELRQAMSENLVEIYYKHYNDNIAV